MTAGEQEPSGETSLPTVAILDARPQQAAAVQAILRAAIPSFLAEPGCERYEILAEIDRPTRFVLLEQWRDAAALAAHFESAAFKAMAAKLEALLAAPPQVMSLQRL